ncbi:nucleotidyltransferase domain-containing protein [Psychrobium sp. 1_MG-2023]|uniref:nucleotidyltransferase domain-containing protein n=1 Tax=Psychrobium sp. 1_MG-2023 TaxID=3062624 RepID=UPI000C31C1EC|nr:nucleotidyltransferase domain-containing protein [Psychrobium sp. 1_MG-2023]MDP2562918.1 nucleotidyltransferase domain-containing protein [Psychrobium sp. 1_MG-2023]PKF53753.1 hypothetical protein CW748_17685 [Alteromonadales bacterium alter-6D02]
MNQNINELLLERYKKKFRIESLGIFGSFARGSKEYNDIDVIIITKQKIYRKDSFLYEGVTFDVIISHYENFHFLCNKSHQEWVFIFKDIKVLLDVNDRLLYLKKLTSQSFKLGPTKISRGDYREYFSKCISSQRKLASQLEQNDTFQLYAILGELLTYILMLWCGVNQVWFDKRKSLLHLQLREHFPDLYTLSQGAKKEQWIDMNNAISDVLIDISNISGYEPRGDIVKEIDLRFGR